MKIKDIIKNIRGTFMLPERVYYFGKIKHGCPYFYPWNFNRTILTIGKKHPEYLRCRYFRFAGLEISCGWPFAIAKYDLGWKDKFGSPRFEWSSSFQIYLFGLQFCIWWIAPGGDNDKYWEQVLWYLNYCDKDIVKAKETWGWVDSETHKSTWNNNFLA